MPLPAVRLLLQPMLTPRSLLLMLCIWWRRPCQLPETLLTFLPAGVLARPIASDPAEAAPIVAGMPSTDPPASSAAWPAQSSKPRQKAPASSGRNGGGLASLIAPPAHPAGPTISTGTVPPRRMATVSDQVLTCLLWTLYHSPIHPFRSVIPSLIHSFIASCLHSFFASFLHSFLQIYNTCRLVPVPCPQCWQNPVSAVPYLVLISAHRATRVTVSAHILPSSCHAQHAPLFLLSFLSTKAWLQGLQALWL